MAVVVKLNSRAVEQLLRSGEIVADLQARGSRIRAAAGDEDFEVEVWDGQNRARVTVRTATFRGRYREARHRTLSKALEAGRG